jgi:hypothetical protein
VAEHWQRQVNPFKGVHPPFVGFCFPRFDRSRGIILEKGVDMLLIDGEQVFEMTEDKDTHPVRGQWL